MQDVQESLPPDLQSLEPGPGWVLLKPLHRTGTHGGVLLSSGTELATYIRVGSVVDVGPPRQLEFGGTETVRCAKGDTVLYDASKGGFDVNIQGEEHKMVRYVAIGGPCTVAGDVYAAKERPRVEAILGAFARDVANGAPLPRIAREN